MRSLIASAVIALGCVSCVAPGSLVLPEIPNAPDDWPAFSAAVIPGSECPPIEGVYVEPPTVHRAGAKKNFLPRDDMRLYFSYVPLNRAQRRQLPLGTLAVQRRGFVVRQPQSSHFFFAFLNNSATDILEYNFRSGEGDFECHRGHIEFPTLISYATTEGGSTNFQVRNVLFLDETGALVIQSTRGPYRGSPAQMAREVSYEFFRYPRSDEQDK